jgi:hypothetical protein
LIVGLTSLLYQSTTTSAAKPPGRGDNHAQKIYAFLITEFADSIPHHFILPRRGDICGGIRAATSANGSSYRKRDRQGAA